MSSQVFFSAFALMASQMVGVGPQNSFLLRQGVARKHVLPVVVICIACDVLLLAMGVFGFGKVLKGMPMLLEVLFWLGIVFMCCLGLRSLRSAMRTQVLDLDGEAMQCPDQVKRHALAVTLLNPLVWMDSVVLIGSVSAVYVAADQWFFMTGALAASALWFVSVGFGAGQLAPWFSRPGSWRMLDLCIGGMMFYMALSLVWQHGYL